MAQLNGRRIQLPWERMSHYFLSHNSFKAAFEGSCFMLSTIDVQPKSIFNFVRMFARFAFCCWKMLALDFDVAKRADVVHQWTDALWRWNLSWKNHVLCDNKLRSLTVLSINKIIRTRPAHIFGNHDPRRSRASVVSATLIKCHLLTG